MKKVVSFDMELIPGIDNYKYKTKEIIDDKTWKETNS